MLIPSANPNILTNTNEISGLVGTVEYYKFTRNNIFELNGTGDRPFTLAAGAQTLPLVYFNNDPPAVSATTNVITFQVSLANQVALGNFTPGLDTVSVAGTFQRPPHWTAGVVLLTNSGINNLYIGTCTNDGNYPGTYEEFKFVITRFGSDIWESRNNRSFVLTNNDVLPIQYFNDTLAVPVTFSVDMSGVPGFQPTDSVAVRGSFNNWAGGDLLIPSADPNILTNTFIIFGAMGAGEYYKFTWLDTFESDIAGNRSFTLRATDQTVPLDYFNDQPPAVSATTNSITFRVSLANQVTMGNFTPDVDIVSVAGTFQSLSHWTPGAFQLTNSGLNNLYVTSEKLI